MTTNTKALGFALFTLLASSLVGCGGAAWQVRRGAWSGEIALHGSLTDAHYAAEDTMLAHCGGRARIVYGAEAERVAIADTSSVPPHEVAVDHGGRRMHYVCVSRAPSAFQGRQSEIVGTTARAQVTSGDL